MNDQELKEGIELIIENSKRLLDDAQYLFDGERYMPAAFFALSAEEEAGKAFMLLDYLRNGKDLTKTRWKRKGFIYHPKKLSESMKKRGLYYDKIYASIRGGIYTREYFIRWYGKEHSEMKEDCLYVDRDFDRDIWKSPINPPAFGKNYAEAFLHRAKITIKLAEEEFAMIN